MINKLELIEAGVFQDNRGLVAFANDFPLSEFKRFYIIQNSVSSPVRAWHAHKLEAKAIFPVSGTFFVGAIEVEDWVNPPLDKNPEIFELDSKRPSILLIPGGYANGFRSVSPDASFLIFSSMTLDESLGDDFRFPPNTWNI